MANLLESKKPFVGCKVYGPIWHKNERRNMVVIVRQDKTMTSMSYARYLMCVKYSRLLRPNEQADHKDNDKSNDSLDNLQVLTSKQNRAKQSLDNPGRVVTFNCAYCGKQKTVRKGQDWKLNRRGYAYCSRICGYNAVTERNRNNPRGRTAPQAVL